MPLYTMTDAAIKAVPTTSFGAAGVRERADLQRLLREHIEIVSPETLIIAEEFGSWDASYRRIDLLGLDRYANLVVIELKRDDTGAHMELQALRYAAMVARMTFDQAVNAFHAYQTQTQPAGMSNGTVQSADSESVTRDDAEARLLKFLDWSEPNESSFAKEVRIVLVSADFSRELMTSVMWLNERELDIRCVQVQPYRHGADLLLQVDQVLPLREASEYQVQVREKARKERATPSGVGPDFTRYDLTIDGITQPRLWKRRLIHSAVRHVIDRFGKTPDEIADVIQHGRPWAWVEGEHDAESFRAALVALAESGGPSLDARRFVIRDGELLSSGGRTYAFTNQWGTNTLAAMEALRTAFPDADIRYQASADA